MTEEKLRKAKFPMKRPTWLLRLMIIEPQRICEPAELAEWKRRHPVPQRSFGN